MLNIRLFDFSDTDYQARMTIRNLCWPDMPTNKEMMQYRDRAWPPRFYKKRYLAELNGVVIGMAVVNEIPSAYKPGKYAIHIDMHPDHRRQGHATVIYNFLLNILAQHDPTPRTFVSEVREHMAPGIAMLDTLGFTRVMRYAISELDVPAFDPAPFAEVAARVAESGIKIRTLTEVMADDPDWFDKLYELDWSLHQDVPSTDPITKPTKEEFRQHLNSPRKLEDGYFFALDGDEFIGLSRFHADLIDPKKLHTGMTGVLRSHRRRGIATALKLRAIAFAQRYGATTVDTDNEENNPMFQINLKLGFKPVPAWVEYQKAL